MPFFKSAWSIWLSLNPLPSFTDGWLSSFNDSMSQGRWSRGHQKHWQWPSHQVIKLWGPANEVSDDLFILYFCWRQCSVWSAVAWPPQDTPASPAPCSSEHCRCPLDNFNFAILMAFLCFSRSDWCQSPAKLKSRKVSSKQWRGPIASWQPAYCGCYGRLFSTWLVYQFPFSHARQGINPCWAFVPLFFLITFLLVLGPCK